MRGAALLYRLLPTLGVLGALLLPAAGAGGFALGLDPASSDPVDLPAGQTLALTLYLHRDAGGPTLSGTACLDGDGDEVCYWQVRVLGSGGVTFPASAVDPAGGDVTWNGPSSVEILANGGTPTTGGQRGSVALFDLTATTGASGGQIHVEGRWLDASLQRQSALRALVGSVPGCTDDRDGDGVCDADDSCPFVDDPAQADGDGDGRGDACECGDEDGSGALNVGDILAINSCLFAGGCTDRCDANGDGSCNISDILKVNFDIFSPNSSTCAAQPCAGTSTACVP